MNFDVPYGITRRISGTTIAATRERVTAALKEDGFGVLTEIDVQSTLEFTATIARRSDRRASSASTSTPRY